MPDAVKQTLCVLNRKVDTFTCMITSSLQENYDVQPVQIWEFLVGEPWYRIMLNSKVKIGSFALEEIQKKEEEDWTRLHIAKMLLVKSKLEELVRANASVHIQDGIVVVIPDRYALIQDTLFQHNQAQLRLLSEGFELAHLPK